MTEPTAPSDGPSNAAQPLARWKFVYDYNDDLRGHVAGELLLRSDGVLLRRMDTSFYSDGATTWRYGPWNTVEWWDGDTQPDRATRTLQEHGYELFPPSPVPIDQHTAGPFPDQPDLNG